MASLVSILYAISNSHFTFPFHSFFKLFLNSPTAYLMINRDVKRRNEKQNEIENEMSNKNVICVDWRRQANERFYLNSAYNTRMVGERVGEFILFLKDSGFIDSFDSVHIVGFSLGAQVAGYAGKFVRMSRITKVGRITGNYQRICNCITLQYCNVLEFTN